MITQEHVQRFDKSTPKVQTLLWSSSLVVCCHFPFPLFRQKKAMEDTSDSLADTKKEEVSDSRAER